jgi:hypothetical protein
VNAYPLQAGVKPKKHMLDNEISENMKEDIRDKYKFTLEQSRQCS